LVTKLEASVKHRERGWVCLAMQIRGLGADSGPHLPPAQAAMSNASSCWA
jgi:hypothetical protein